MTNGIFHAKGPFEDDIFFLVFDPLHEKLHVCRFRTSDLKHFRLEPSLHSGYKSAKLPEINRSEQVRK